MALVKTSRIHGDIELTGLGILVTLDFTLVDDLRPSDMSFNFMVENNVHVNGNFHKGELIHYSVNGGTVSDNVMSVLVASLTDVEEEYTTQE